MLKAQEERIINKFFEKLAVEKEKWKRELG